MRLPRLRSARRRSTRSETWTRSVERFRRSFPRLLRADFWRSGEVAAWRDWLFGRNQLEKKRPAKRQRRGKRGWAAAWGLTPHASTFEPLEVRAMLSLSAGSLDTTFNTNGKII